MYYSCSHHISTDDVLQRATEAQPPILGCARLRGFGEILRRISKSLERISHKKRKFVYVHSPQLAPLTYNQTTTSIFQSTVGDERKKTKTLRFRLQRLRTVAASVCVFFFNHAVDDAVSACLLAVLPGARSRQVGNSCCLSERLEYECRLTYLPVVVLKRKTQHGYESSSLSTSCTAPGDNVRWCDVYPTTPTAPGWTLRPVPSEGPLLPTWW